MKRQQQREGTGPNKGTVRDRVRESGRLSESEALTGTLEHRHHHSIDHLVLGKKNTRGKVLGKERQGEDGRVEKPATCTCCGDLDWPSDS